MSLRRNRGRRHFANILSSVAKARKKADFVIVSVHWGHEYHTEPEASQVEMARKLMDAGAKLIVGHHPHVPQGMEIYKKGLIVYSLGNFVFGSRNSLQTHNILLEVTFEKEKKKVSYANIYPVWGTYKKGTHEVRPLEPEEAHEFWREFYLQCDSLNRKNEFKLSVNRRGWGRLIIFDPADVSQIVEKFLAFVVAQGKLLQGFLDIAAGAEDGVDIAFLVPVVRFRKRDKLPVQGCGAGIFAVLQAKPGVDPEHIRFVGVGQKLQKLKDHVLAPLRLGHMQVIQQEFGRTQTEMQGFPERPHRKIRVSQVPQDQPAQMIRMREIQLVFDRFVGQLQRLLQRGVAI